MMSEALWSALSHPATIVGQSSGVDMWLAAAAIMAVTTLWMATVGRRMMQHSPLLAVLVGCAFLPVLTIVSAFVLVWSSPRGTDGGGMLLIGALALSICALPLTFATSMLCALAQRKGPASE